MAAPSAPLTLTASERTLLAKWKEAPETLHAIRRRVEICLLASNGLSDQNIAGRLRVSRPTVALWRRRFQDRGVCALILRSGIGGGRGTTYTLNGQIIDRTFALQRSAPKLGTSRRIAQLFGINHATVARVWQRAGISKLRRVPLLSVQDMLFLRVAEVAAIHIDPLLNAVFVAVPHACLERLLRFGFTERAWFRPSSAEDTFLRAVASMTDRVLNDASTKWWQPSLFVRLLNDLDVQTSGKLSFLVGCVCRDEALKDILSQLAKHRRFAWLFSSDRDVGMHDLRTILGSAGDEAGSTIKFGSLRALTKCILAQIQDTQRIPTFSARVQLEEIDEMPEWKKFRSEE